MHSHRLYFLFICEAKKKAHLKIAESVSLDPSEAKLVELKLLAQS